MRQQRSPSPSTSAVTSPCRVVVATVIALALSCVGATSAAVVGDDIVLDNARYLPWSADDATSPYLTRTFAGLVIPIDADGGMFATSSASGVDEVWPMDHPTALFTFASEMTMDGAYDDETGEIAGTFDFSGNVSSSTTIEREDQAPLTLQSRSDVTYAGSFFRQVSKETDATIIELRGVMRVVGEAQNVQLEWEPTSQTVDRIYRVAFDPLLPTTSAADPATPGDTATTDGAEGSETGADGADEAGAGAATTDNSSASNNGAIIAALAVVAALLAALVIGLKVRRKPPIVAAGSSPGPETEDDHDKATITLALTHPAGRSPNVFTSGWVFGARAISDPGGPNQTDISDRVRWSGSGTFRPNTGSLSRPAFAAPGTNQIVLEVDADGASATRSFTVSAVTPGGFAHVGSRAFCPSDSHGCPGCPHLDVVGSVQTGSALVTVAGTPAARVGDSGTHANCCGANTFTITSGDSSVLIDGRPAARIGSETAHCGGPGHLTT